MKKLVLAFLFLLETISAQSWSLHFPGTVAYVQIPSSSAFSFVSAMTIEAWVKVDAFDKDWQAIVTRGDNSWRLHRNAETNYIAFSTTNLSNVNLISTISINDGLWHHIAGVYNGSTKHLYIDGELNVSVSVTGTLATNTKVVQIGGNADYSDRRFKGNIIEYGFLGLHKFLRIKNLFYYVLL